MREDVSPRGSAQARARDHNTGGVGERPLDQFPDKSVASAGGFGQSDLMQLDTPALTITELRADDPADVEASYDIERAALAHAVPDFPPPSRYRHPNHLRRDFPGRTAT